MIFYNFFPNINENFKLKVKYNNRDVEINFQEGVYNVSDISDIINLELKENSIDIEDPIKMIVDINRYKILIIVKEDFKLILDKNFMKLLGFSKYIINSGYNRSDLTPNIDKTKYLKIFCFKLLYYNEYKSYLRYETFMLREPYKRLMTDVLLK